MAMLELGAVGFVALYLIMRLQDVLPLDPAGQAGISADLAFDTTISFVANTNWRSQPCSGGWFTGSSCQVPKRTGTMRPPPVPPTMPRTIFRY